MRRKPVNPMHKGFNYLTLLLLFANGTPQAFSATEGVVSVVNPSFEEPVTSNFDTTVSGWFEEHNDIYREAVQNMDSSTNVPSTEFGENWLVLTAFGGIYQAIDTYSPDWGYTFSGLFIGARLTRNFGPLQVELWVGNGTGSNGTELSSIATLRDSVTLNIVESDSLNTRTVDDFTLYTGNVDTEGDTVWLRISSISNPDETKDSQSFCDNVNITAGYNPRLWGGLPVDETGHVETGNKLGWWMVDYAPYLWSYSLNKWIYFPEPDPGWTGAWIYIPQAAKTVSAPEYTPAGGHYGNGVMVTITSETPGATIYYTTDGSEPSQDNGTLYSEPIEVDEASEIRAVAYKDGLADSPIHDAIYGIGRINLFPPQDVVDVGNSALNIRYGKSFSSAYTNDTTSGGWQITQALAVASGNSSAEDKMLEQIRISLEGNYCVSANGGYPAQHERHITGAYTILQGTEFWNTVLSEEERNKITLLMKAVLVSSAYTTADATYSGNVTTLDGDTNLNRGWNPNYREGMFGGLIHATVFFGGVSAVEEILNNYDHAAFLEELQTAGLTNTYRIFNWAANYPDSGAPSGAQIEANIYNYRYFGERLKSPMSQLHDLTVFTYGGNVSCGLNNGAGILVGDTPTGVIASGCENLPNIGAKGMLAEFASGDAKGPRSSITYAYDGFRPNLTNHVVVLNGGYWMPGPLADTILNRLNIGITDLEYKLQQGYRNYAKGQGSTYVFDITHSAYSSSFNTTLPLWFDMLKPYHGL